MGDVLNLVLLLDSKMQTTSIKPTIVDSFNSSLLSASPSSLSDESSVESYSWSLFDCFEQLICFDCITVIFFVVVTARARSGFTWFGCTRSFGSTTTSASAATPLVLLLLLTGRGLLPLRFESLLLQLLVNMIAQKLPDDENEFGHLLNADTVMDVLIKLPGCNAIVLVIQLIAFLYSKY